MISSESNFHKNETLSDGLESLCKKCVKDYNLKNIDKITLKTKDWNKNNPEKIKQNEKKYNEQNKEKRNVCLKSKRETDVKFRLISNIRNRFYKSLKGLTKQSSTKDILGIDINLYRQWIEWQMTPEMNWNNAKTDHVKLICMFDISNEDEIKEAFCWKNTQALFKQDPLHKGIKFNFLGYQLQFNKAYHFLRFKDQER